MEYRARRASVDFYAVDSAIVLSHKTHLVIIIAKIAFICCGLFPERQTLGKICAPVFSIFFLGGEGGSLPRSIAYHITLTLYSHCPSQVPIRPKISVLAASSSDLQRIQLKFISVPEARL